VVVFDELELMIHFQVPLQNSLRRIGQASRCPRLTAKLTSALVQLLSTWCLRLTANLPSALVQPLIYLVFRSNCQRTWCPGPAANLPAVLA